jgi:hypothetical protein
MPYQSQDDKKILEDALKPLQAEIGRLRAIVRINLMRSCGATHAEIDRLLDEASEVSRPPRETPGA